MASRKRAPAEAETHDPPSDEAPREARHDAGLAPLLDALCELIRQGRQQALRAVDAAQVQTCWQIGRHIVEFEQGGAERAVFGAWLLPRLAERLTAEFGRGFDASNLRHMRLFYRAFPIRDALLHELSWTHYRALARIESEAARHWYMNEAVTLNWSARALDRQISTLYYDGLLLSRDKPSLEMEARKLLAPLQATPREFVRDPVLLEFLGLPGTGKLLESRPRSTTAAAKPRTKTRKKS